MRLDMCVCVLLLLVAAMPALAGPRGVSVAGPAFSERQQQSVLARVGDSAAMRCRVLRLADRVVSWVRSSDLQILTHAGYVFTADARVSCSEAPAGPEVASEGAEEATEEPYDVLTSRDEGWQRAGSVHTLRIERLREADSGRYECQINTEPKLSLFFNLTVVAESALPTVTVRALGEGGVAWARAGGAAQLACEARYEPAPAPALQAALPPLRIRWTHEGETLDPQSPRGGISLDTERWAARAVSRLTLAAIDARDAGRYLCAAADRSAALRLRIRGLDDEDYQLVEAEGEMERMQRDQAVARVSAAAGAVAEAEAGVWAGAARASWTLLLALALT